MASRIKIKFDNGEDKINLPALPTLVLTLGLRLFRKQVDGALKRHLYRQDNPFKMDIDCQYLINLIKSSKKEIKKYDPFILLEVVATDTYLLIEVV